ncbi:MAG: glutathione S-transferase family protein [Hyphomicrobiaceae bacterium]
MSDMILHHYPQSPVAEKVRVSLGIKGLSWRSVEIPRIPPKPDLMPLTGGYRRTPVLQIGADVYCDSMCILHELERRAPSPAFFPSNSAGLGWLVFQAAERAMMKDAIAIVLGANVRDLPKEFADDRGRLYFGPDYDLEDVASHLPHIFAQVRTHLGWVDQRLSGGAKFLFGDAAGLADAAIYYLVWFIRGRWAGGPAFLSEFPALEAWEKRVAAIGHGTPTDLSANDALEIARAAKPSEPMTGDPLDPQGLKPGMRVAVVPDGDGGDPPVKGAVHVVSHEIIGILRDDPRVGEICIHFPRVGYRITVLD